MVEYRSPFRYIAKPSAPPVSKAGAVGFSTTAASNDVLQNKRRFDAIDVAGIVSISLQHQSGCLRRTFLLVSDQGGPSPSLLALPAHRRARRVL